MLERIAHPEALGLLRHNVRAAILSEVNEAVPDIGIEDEPKLNIYAPVVEVERDGGRSQSLLEKVGIVGQFPLIVVTEDPVGEARVSVFASERFDYDTQWRSSVWERGREIKVTEIRLKSREIFGPLKAFPLKVERSGGITFVSSVTYSRRGEDEFAIGAENTGREKVLLLIDRGNWDFQLASASLPKGWREVFPGGRLLDFPKAEERPHEVMTALSPEAQEIAQQIKDGNGSKAFGKIRSVISKFPRYSGPVLGKEKVRVADLGNEGTSVEMEDEFDNRLIVTLNNLDPKRLEELCDRGRVTAGTLLECFRKTENGSQPRLYMEIELWGGDIRIDSHPVMWDLVSRRLLESWQRLPYSVRSSEDLREVLQDEQALIPRIISELKMPASLLWQSSGLAMGAGSVSRRNRGRNDRFEEKPSRRQERSSELRFSEYKTNQLLEGLSSSGSMNSTETVRKGSNDTPEGKKKYWTKKAARSKGSKVQAKNASKGKGKSKS